MFASFNVPINSVSPCMSQVDDGFEPLPAAIRPPQPFGALQVPGSALRMAPGSGWKCLSLWTLTHHLRGHLLLVFRNSQKVQEWLTELEQTETNMTTSFKNKSRLSVINLTWIRWETDVAWFTWNWKQTPCSSETHSLFVLLIQHAVNRQQFGLQA